MPEIYIKKYGVYIGVLYNETKM